MLQLPRVLWITLYVVLCIATGASLALDGPPWPFVLLCCVSLGFWALTDPAPRRSRKH